ncbi:MAG: hypothetical protein IT426_10085 [Pirellulales bacterium]|nr:hypothetical protein [Pirellulales bacterium]
MVTVVLVVGLAFALLALGFGAGSVHLPANRQDYEPVQPLAFSHRLHAGELNIACLHCHGAAEKSRHAGIPAASTCMNCHKLVTAPMAAVRAEDELAQKEKRQPRRIVSPELQKLYDSLGLSLNEKRELAPDPRKPLRPIPWIKVYSLPDFAYFDHRAHVRVGVACEKCHGAVETMERVRQIGDLSMGWCVNCHRTADREGINGAQVHASTDCDICHH